MDGLTVNITNGYPALGDSTTRSPTRPASVCRDGDGYDIH